MILAIIFSNLSSKMLGKVNELEPMTMYVWQHVQAMLMVEGSKMERQRLGPYLGSGTG